MNMTISKGCAVQNFPEARNLKEGESVRATVRSSSSPTGSVVVNIKRLTEEYYYVGQVN